MKRILLILCIISMASTIASAGASPTDSVSWNVWAKAWKTYLANPSQLNGERLYAVLPAVHDRSVRSDSSSYWSIYGTLGSLERLVLKQQRIAVRIAFKLFAICDADFCETLDQMLGQLIRRNPTMFLEELSRNRANMGDLGGLLLNLGDQFVDEPAKSDREVRLRIKSLKLVRKPLLESIRVECVTKLESHFR
jgi:hypothetical protein